MTLASPPSTLSDRDRLELADEAVATVRRWLTESESGSESASGSGSRAGSGGRDASAERLAGVLRDPRGLEFTIGFVDRVVRPEDLRVAARDLHALGSITPAFLPWYLRAAIRVGAGLARLAPWPIVPIARAVLRRMVAHLVVDATPDRLGTSLDRVRAGGARLNLNLLGEAVLGDGEADRRLEGTRELLARDDVDYVSIKVSSVVSQVSMWAFDETVERVAERLTPLFELAAESPSPKFINLDMEEFKDLDLTIAVFQRVLEQPRLHSLEAGIVLQAYLPDALAALQRLTVWAQRRRAAGGAGIKVRVVKGANLAMERVDAAMHGWPLATVGSKRAADTNYKRVLDWALRPEHTAAVRIGVAGHNLFDVAFAWLLATRRGVATGAGAAVEFEMLLGMATEQAAAVTRDVGGLLLYTPVVHPREFDSAISYLIRRLEENASSENFMSGIFELDDPAVFAREEERFRASLDELDDAVPSSNRVQDRSGSGDGSARLAGGAFENAADTDPAIAPNRAWGRGILSRVASSTLGADTIGAHRVGDEHAVDALVAGTLAAADAWQARSWQDRAALLHAAGESLEAHRAALIEVMASETGKVIAEADVEVSEAVDFAHYYAARSLDLAGIEEADFVPSRLVVVTPPWNFPVAIPAGSVLSALASGSGVVLKPAPQARRCSAVLIEALWAAGVPRELLALADIDEGDLSRRLIAHPAVDRVILTGAFETAALFRSWRADLPLLAETSGKNAIIVTPSADLDLAVADIVKSAFGHAGQKCSAASLVILVGSVVTSERFRHQLVDAVETLRVGLPQNPVTQLGPVVEAPRGKLLRALTELEPGQSWLVEPRAVTETLWTPGVREGVQPGSEFHLTEYFAPVLGIMRAATLDDAIALQNAGDYGLTAGLHSLDPTEVAHWLDTVEAGNLYVNRGITGAIVRRQPFGGWKRSTVGASAKAGGPNYLMTLGGWRPRPHVEVDDLDLDAVSPAVAALIEGAQPGLDFDEYQAVRRAAESDERAWNREFGVARDVSGLGVERNVLRYRPVPVALRLSEGRPLGELVRLLAAAARVGSAVTVSTALAPPTVLAELFGPGELVVESDAAFLDRVRSDGLAEARIRIAGDPDAASALAHALGGDPDVAIHAGPVTGAGRVELLAFLREQAVAITAHRFGNPDEALLALEL